MLRFNLQKIKNDSTCRAFVNYFSSSKLWRSHKSFREPPGYVSAYRWMKERPVLESLQASLFGSSSDYHHSEAETKFLSTQVHASLSGKPITNGFTYDVINSISEIPKLDSKLLANLGRMGFNLLTPVQRHSIGILSVNEIVRLDVHEVDKTSIDTDEIETELVSERVVGKYDLMAAAQTGSGKTLAYLIPLLNRILTVYPYEAMQSVLNGSSGCQFPTGLILAPTRELVQQILSQLVKLCYRTFARPVSFFGGERPDKQLNELNKGCHLIVATPGRLLDFLRRDVISLKHCRKLHSYRTKYHDMESMQSYENIAYRKLGHVKALETLLQAASFSLVLDEADRMLDMGFEEQIRNILENPEYQMPPARDSERQTALFSATFPREVTLLARNFLRGSNCVSLTLRDLEHGAGVTVPTWGKSQNRSESELCQLTQIIPREINQRVEFLEENSQTSVPTRLAQLIHEINAENNPNSSDLTTTKVNRILVFCNTKREVDRIDSYLYKKGFHSAGIHGDKSQSHRNKALDLFRKGTAHILVASSVAARGLDIPNVRAVINIGLPNEVDDYVHRIGRTGRMGQTGEAITLINEDMLISQPSAKHVSNGICRLIKASTGTVDNVPQILLKYAGLLNGRNFDAGDHSKTSYHKERRSFKDYSKKRYKTEDELSRRYSL